MDIKRFKEMSKKFSPRIAIRLRGKHGIGKSQSVYQVAEEIYSDFYKDSINALKYNWSFEKGLPVIERRLSQLTEGDIVGLPIMENGATQFKPCEWLLDACQRPVVLFLDEINRALEPVKQAMFQLADSRCFYGYTLHPETRLFVAENIGDQYQVQSNDPAEISRYAIVDLEPSREEWMDWAVKNCHMNTVEFIRANPNLLEFEGTYENNVKYPDRRAWARLDSELTYADLMDSPEQSEFHAMVLSMVGAESASAFVDFCKNREKQISAKDILEDWAKSKKRIFGKLAGTENESPERYIEASYKLGDWLKVNKLNDRQAEQLAAFVVDSPAEVCITTWGFLSEIEDNLFKMHPLLKAVIVERTTKMTPEEIQKMSENQEAHEKAKEKAEAAATETAKTAKPAKSVKAKK